MCIKLSTNRDYLCWARGIGVIGIGDWLLILHYVLPVIALGLAQSLISLTQNFLEYTMKYWKVESTLSKAE